MRLYSGFILLTTAALLASCNTQNLPDPNQSSAIVVSQETATTQPSAETQQVSNDSKLQLNIGGGSMNSLSTERLTVSAVRMGGQQGGEMRFVKNQVIITSAKAEKVKAWVKQVGGEIVVSPETYFAQAKAMSAKMPKGTAQVKAANFKREGPMNETYLVNLPVGFLEKKGRSAAEAMRQRGFYGEFQIATLSDAGLLSLRGESDMQIEPNFLAQPQATSFTFPYGVDGRLNGSWIPTSEIWHLGPKGLNLEPLWEKGYTGKNVGVAVLDTGFQYNSTYYNTPQAFGPEINHWSPFSNASVDAQSTLYQTNFPWIAYNFSQNQGWADPGPLNYHGQVVAEFATGAADNGYGGAGSAPDGFTAMMQLGYSGGGAYSFYDASRAIDLARMNGYKVANLSFGQPVYCGFEYPNTNLRGTLNYAAQNGMLIFASAGNFPGYRTKANNTVLCNFGGSATVIPAGWSESVISVGATDSNGNAYTGGATGPLVDIWVPGVNVLGTRKDCISSGTWCVENIANDTMQYYTGTSYSSPLAAGLAADLVQAWNNVPNHKPLKRAQMAWILMNSTRSLGGNVKVVDGAQALNYVLNNSYDEFGYPGY